ncbi:MAG: DsbA family protein [Actinomycetota bacterium]|nr:DsbA family protein [Actinomycetota bacterium]
MIWLPFDLHPEYPPEGIPRARLEARYGEGFSDHVARTIEAAGFDHRPPPRVPRSLRSLQLAELARDEGRHQAAHTRLFAAYWSQGRDIGDVDVLAAVAADAGLDPDKARAVLEQGAFADRVRESTEAAHRVGVDAVPAWLVDRTHLVLGAQPHRVFAEVLEQLGHVPQDGDDEDGLGPAAM